MSDAEIHNYGYNIYRHDRVALLLAIDTAERLYTPGSVWRSTTFNSMSITLESQEGALLVATTYLPSGVDYMSATNTTNSTAGQTLTRCPSSLWTLMRPLMTLVAFTYPNMTRPSATPETFP